MPRSHPGAGSCVAAAALAVCCANAPGAAPGGGVDRPTTVVQFSYDALDPETVRIAADGNVTWVNTASDTQGYIVFPLSIASSFRCSDLGPNFSRTLNDYRSLPIGGMQSDRVALPCPLAPGSHDYEIWIVGAGFGDESEEAPQQVLHGTIVVE